MNHAPAVTRAGVSNLHIMKNMTNILITITSLKNAASHNHTLNQRLIADERSFNQFLGLYEDRKIDIWFEIHGAIRTKNVRLWYVEQPPSLWTLLIQRYEKACEDERQYEALKAVLPHRDFKTDDDIMSQPFEALRPLEKRWVIAVNNVGESRMGKLF